MSSNNYQLKLKQTQQLSQGLQQSLRVLQMSGIEIEREVEDWLADNPLLERAEQPERLYEPSRPNASVSARTLSLEEDDPAAWDSLVQEETLNSYLHKQVCEHPLTQIQAAHVHILIDFLNEQGYLTETLEEIVDHTPLEWMLSEEDLEIALEHLQAFDPPGIATANLSQSLLFQLDRLPLSDERRCAAKIVMHHLDQISQNQPKNINRFTKLLPDYSEATIKAALAMITGLNPYPSYGFAAEEPTAYVRPDVFVEQDKNGIWFALGNEEAWPQVQLNPELAEALAEEESLDPVWREKIALAKQKLDMLNQRKQTVLRVAEYIVEKQQDFFIFGEIGMVPMLLKDCAASLDLAESTISRAVNSKYLACPQGLFALRYFFSQNAVGSDENGGISSTAIRSVIEQLVQNENKQKPYSDSAIHGLLQQQGINIARRTVAKYREQLGIAPVQQRRE